MTPPPLHFPRVVLPVSFSFHRCTFPWNLGPRKKPAPPAPPFFLLSGPRSPPSFSIFPVPFRSFFPHPYFHVSFVFFRRCFLIQPAQPLPSLKKKSPARSFPRSPPTFNINLFHCLTPRCWTLLGPPPPLPPPFGGSFRGQPFLEPSWEQTSCFHRAQIDWFFVPDVQGPLICCRSDCVLKCYPSSVCECCVVTSPCGVRRPSACSSH